EFGFSDADGNALAAVKIGTLPGAGTLTNNGVAVAAGQTVSTADIAAGLLRFTPVAGASGAAYASFTFQVKDDGGTANGGVDLDPTARTMTVNVTAVNDAPSGANNTVTMLEDGAYVFAASDFGFSDADGNALAAVRIGTLPNNGTLTSNGVAVSAGQAVSAADIAAGLLRFTPAANGSGAGYASFSFQLQDNGGTANGGVDVDPTARTMTVNVAAVNDAPVGANGTVILQQDGVYVFSAADFGFSDSDGNAFAGVVVATVPPGGVISDNGTPVAAGQSVSAANVAAGLVRYTPAFGASGAPYASFTFRVQDSGGTANGGADTDPVARTMTINVIPPLAAGPGVDPVPAPPAPVPAPAPAPLQPVATPPSQNAPVALSAQTPPAAASARLLLASNDVFGTRVDVDEGFRVPVAAAQPLPAVFATAQRLTGTIPTAVPGFGLSGSTALAEQKQLDFQLFGTTAVVDSSSGSASRASGLAGELDRMRDDLGEQTELEHWMSGSMAVGSFGLTVGYVLWLLRGGALIASLLSSLPAWRLIDPLPVLSRLDEEDETDEDDDAFVSFAEANPPFPLDPEKA
ncbi:MAG TPA: Ig-like domain-containing protein, partial [Burkholderiales bacterium]